MNPGKLNVDLHCHSTVSDSTLAPREVVRRALLSKPAQALAAPSYAPRNNLLRLMQGVAPLSAPIGVGIANSEQ